MSPTRDTRSAHLILLK